MSESKSVSFYLSWADASTVNDSAQGRCIYQDADPAGNLKVCEHWAPDVLLVGAGGVSGRGGISSGVGSGVGSGDSGLHQLGRGTPVSLHLQYVCGFCAVWCWRRMASGCVVLMKHSWVSFYRSLYHFMHRKLNNRLLFSSDLGARFLDPILCFLYSAAQNPSCGHPGHIQGQVHVRLFPLYTTFLPSHRSRHVEYLQAISCWFKQWDVGITSTIYAFVASSMVMNTCFVHSQGCLSPNWSDEIPEVTTP